jgi:4-amino-4-deoxy-L-arabinose transferase-like glycosyltransferase
VQSGLKEAAMQRRQAWAHLWGIVLVLLLGSGLRMVGLEQSPPGLAPDEACNSYDAYSIWHTGRDQHGVFLPTVMRALNDYRMPLFIYTQAPLVGAGGLTVFNARLAAAFWGILAIAALYRLGENGFIPR